MRAVRNVAIILVLALIVAAVPGGGEVARGIVAAMTIAFLVMIGLAGYQLYRQNRFAYMSLDERMRALLVISLGAIVLMIAGADELLDDGFGIFVWLSVIGISVYAIVRVYQDSRSY